MSKRGQAWTAVLAGVSISGFLFYLLNITDSALLFRPQFVGIVLVLGLRGVHLATTTDFVLITIPVNAAIYAAFFYLGLRLFARRSRPL